MKNKKFLLCFVAFIVIAAIAAVLLLPEGVGPQPSESTGSNGSSGASSTATGGEIDPSVSWPSEATTPSQTDPPVTEHKHQLTEVVKKEGTCTEEGIKSYVCDCGYSVDEPIPAKHDYAAEVVAPTCTDRGYTKFTCSLCGDSYEDEPVSAMGHDWTEWQTTKEPTETEDGEMSRTCSDCDAVETMPVDKLGHEHSYTFWGGKDPTCLEGGWKTYTCPCGTEKIDELEPLGHDWTEWEILKEATEAENGERKRACNNCGEEFREPIVYGGHVHSYTETVVEPTCTAGGYTLHSCSCGYSYQDNITEKTNHKNEKTYTDATCSEDAYVIRTCKYCGRTTKTPNGEPLGHDYGDWTITKAATDTENGFQEQTCGRCGYVNVQIIYAPGAKPTSYIDPRLSVLEFGAGDKMYKHDIGSAVVAVTDYSDWENYLTIIILDDNSLDITYYKQDGTKVEFILITVEGYARSLDIQEDGSYIITFNGDPQ